MSKWQPITVYLPDTRGVQLSRYGSGNAKLGLGIYTYSRLPGHVSKPALGLRMLPGRQPKGTCPGASRECQRMCFAVHPVQEAGPVAAIWARNSADSSVPPIPDDCKILRLHVSGDFDTVEYVENWIARLTERSDVMMFAYTRSWRVPALLAKLEELRRLPNVQLFASMDASIPDLPPAGWRRAWTINTGDNPDAERETRLALHHNPRGEATVSDLLTTVITDGTASYVCPEETGRKANCLDCGYCFLGVKNDVTFLEH